MGIVAAINKVGPFAGSNVTTYKVTGLLLACGSQNFTSFEDAVKAVEESLREVAIRPKGGRAASPTGGPSGPISRAQRRDGR